MMRITVEPKPLDNWLAVKVALLFSFLIFLAPSLATAQGILIAKEHGFDSDASATAIEYRSVSRFSTVYNILTPSGGSQRIFGSLIVKDIVFNDVECPATLIYKADAARVVATVDSLRDTASRWPSSRKYLQKYIDANQFALDRLRKGYVLNQGQLLTATAYQMALADNQKRVAEQEAENQKRLAEEQAMRKQEAEEASRREMAERIRKQEVELAALRSRAAELQISLVSLQQAT